MLPFREKQLSPDILCLLYPKLFLIDLQGIEFLFVLPDHGFVFFVQIGQHALVLQPAPLQPFDVAERRMGCPQLTLQELVVHPGFASGHDAEPFEEP